MTRGFKPMDGISFVASNPKKPGSQAHARYRKYCRAKTVAEALRLGANNADLKNDESKGFLTRKGGASAKEKQTASKPQACRAKGQCRPRNTLKKCAASGLALSYVRDVPLLLPGDEEGQKLWKEMKDAGWRRCEFKFLAGARRGLPYTRFVQPPAGKETSRRLVPTGKSINGGFPFALKVYAKRDAKTKARVESLLKRRAEIQMLQKKNRIQRSQEREACVQAYRAKYGQLQGAADLFTKHPGWQENATAFVSPDGERFLKNKCTLNKDIEAHLGKHLLGSSPSSPKYPNGRKPRLGVLKTKTKAVVKEKTKKHVAARKQSQTPRACAVNSASYVKDVPLSASEGEGGQAVWKKMQAKGWRLCQFQFVSGLRKGQPYTRFVKPPAKMLSSKSVGPPTGASINAGFAKAIEIFARASGLNAQTLLEERMATRKVTQQKNMAVERQTCVQAYRGQYGRLEDVASLLERHPGWREKAEAFISPDGQRFIKSMSANNLRVLLLDMEAHMGTQLLKTTRTTSKPTAGHKLQASQRGSKVKTKVKAKSKAVVDAKNLPRIKELTLQLINALLGSGAQRCLKNKHTFSKDLKALIDKQFS